MTIQELYDWAKDRGWENFELCCQYRDEGGLYIGHEKADFDCIEVYRDEKELII